MSPLKTTFYGTHRFAVIILQGLIDSPLFDVQLVITQPDRPVGRKKVLTPPPVKLLAEKHGIAIDQPTSLKSYEFASAVDIAIVSQYGKIIPERLLNIPKYHTLNTHTSLLPKYRGASPIQMALFHGEEETGTTLMCMDAGMDTGPILAQATLPIHPTKDHYEEIEEKLAHLTTTLLEESIPPYVAGTLLPQKQDDTAATYCTLLNKKDGQIDWNRSGAEIFNQYRGFHQWPGVWTMWKDKRIKCTDIRPASDVTIPLPGKMTVINNRLYVGTSTHAIEIIALQPEGKQVMQAQTFMNGYKSQLSEGILLES